MTIPEPTHGTRNIRLAVASAFALCLAVSGLSAFGGPTLMVRTVETLTGVRVDHFAMISKVISSGVLSSPGQARDFADTFVTAPISDGARAGQLWEALRENEIKHHLESTPR